MKQIKNAQSILAFTFLIALLIFIALFVSRKLMKPGLEGMYKNAADMIGDYEEDTNDYYE